MAKVDPSDDRICVGGFHFPLRTLIEGHLGLVGPELCLSVPARFNPAQLSVHVPARSPPPLACPWLRIWIGTLRAISFTIESQLRLRRFFAETTRQ
jgi:hypothetical protein